jgi:hypothetical protein
MNILGPSFKPSPKLVQLVEPFSSFSRKRSKKRSSAPRKVMGTQNFGEAGHGDLRFRQPLAFCEPEQMLFASFSGKRRTIFDQ